MRPAESPPRLLYGHGFASGPRSTKGTALAAHLAARGRSLELLDLRVPSPNGLRLSTMIDVVRGAIGSHEGGDDDARAIAIGSSLGGLTMARAAERDPRIVGLVLLAPAFRIAERWRARMTDDEWRRWRDEGHLEVDDYATGGKLRVEHAFIEDVARVDRDDAPDDTVAAEGLGPRWPDVRVPTVVIQGTRDDTVFPDLARTFVRHRPHVRLVEVDDGHQLAASLPTILSEVDGFLARMGS